jgi:hypothetical protein
MILLSAIDSLLQFLARLEKRQLLRFDFHLLAGFGLRPVYPSYSLTKKEHNPRISTRSPLARASAIPLKKCHNSSSFGFG